jgi:hypothetical protein
VVAAATSPSTPIDFERLAGAIPGHFLRNNAVTRQETKAAIAAALHGVEIVSNPDVAQASPQIVVNTTNQRISIKTSAPWTGNVGSSGDISRVTQSQQQLAGDAAIQALVAQYSGRPEVGEIIVATTPTNRQRKLTAWLKAAGGVAEDVASKVAAELIKSRLGG